MCSSRVSAPVVGTRFSRRWCSIRKATTWIDRIGPILRRRIRQIVRSNRLAISDSPNVSSWPDWVSKLKVCFKNDRIFMVIAFFEWSPVCLLKWPKLLKSEEGCIFRHSYDEVRTVVGAQMNALKSKRSSLSFVESLWGSDSKSTFDWWCAGEDAPLNFLSFRNLEELIVELIHF